MSVTHIKKYDTTEEKNDNLSTPLPTSSSPHNHLDNYSNSINNVVASSEQQ